jgi:hypothetical protein
MLPDRARLSNRTQEPSPRKNLVVSASPEPNLETLTNPVEMFDALRLDTPDPSPNKKELELPSFLVFRIEDMIYSLYAGISKMDKIASKEDTVLDLILNESPEIRTNFWSPPIGISVEPVGKDEFLKIYVSVVPSNNDKSARTVPPVVFEMVKPMTVVDVLGGTVYEPIGVVEVPTFRESFLVNVLAIVYPNAIA